MVADTPALVTAAPVPWKIQDGLPTPKLVLMVPHAPKAMKGLVTHIMRLLGESRGPHAALEMAGEHRRGGLMGTVQARLLRFESPTVPKEGPRGPPKGLGLLLKPRSPPPRLPPAWTRTPTPGPPSLTLSAGPQWGWVPWPSRGSPAHQSDLRLSHAGLPLCLPRGCLLSLVSPEGWWVGTSCSQGGQQRVLPGPCQPGTHRGCFVSFVSAEPQADDGSHLCSGRSRLHLRGSRSLCILGCEQGRTEGQRRGSGESPGNETWQVEVGASRGECVHAGSPAWPRPAVSPP